MVNAIIFDWGGVFTRTASLEDFAQAYAAERDIAEGPFTEKLLAIWHEARVGAVDSRIFWKELGALAGVPAEQFHHDIDTFLGFNPQVLAFVNERLHGKYKLGIISNHIESWFAPHIQEKALEGIFDAVITSYTSKAAKPEPKIYHDALEALQVPADQCVFIDDMEKNLPPARKLGMATILFKNLEQLKTELGKLGVAV